MEQEKLNTLRVRLLCKFLDRGGGSLSELHDWINNELENIDQKTVGLRTLQSLIELLRKGEFIHSEMNLERKRKSKLFKVDYKKKKYCWAVDSAKPQFGDLEEDERYTLPFIAGILKKYEGIPAMKKILDALPDVFGITEQEMNSASVIYHSGAELSNLQTLDDDYSAKVIQLVITIMQHINKGEMIEFFYSPVSIQDDELKTKQYHNVAPLQIRLYNELYYLTAIDTEHQRIINYRIDQIFKLKVDTLRTEDEKCVYFDAKQLEKKYRLKEHFKYILGIWNHGTEDKVYEIHIVFKEWAAAYIKKVKFHSSQKIISINKGNNTCTVSFNLKLGPEQYASQKINERSPELAFLLGRFGKYTQIIKATQM